MHVARFAVSDSRDARVGVLSDDIVTELDGVGAVSELLHLPVGELRERLRGASGPQRRRADVTLVPPIDSSTEVWACGVTYKTSQGARMEESERAASIYELVYDADRPEIFFKSAAWRVAGDGEPVAIRSDSEVNVPEPELAVVVNAHGEVVGFTCCNDVSSRTIEGENPLYLPQAKAYLGGCAVGPAIRPVWEVPDPYNLSIEMTIERDGVAAWQGAAGTWQLHRRIDDLVGYLLRADVFPDGAVLSTGTCLVPPAPFTLQPHDVVRIRIEGVGTLTNSVVEGVAGMAWLVDARSDVRRRARRAGSA
ncbi:MAG TPA: fumarylacetoacetate hydrolase family protein [Jiangellaceae bacterium]